MARSKKETDPADLEKARKRNRASRIRVALRNTPDQVTPADAAFLAEYDRSLGRGASTPAPAPSPAVASDAAGVSSPTTSSEVPTAPPADLSSAAAAVPSPPSVPAVEAAPPPRKIFSAIPPLPIPPTVAKKETPGETRAADWRDEYGARQVGDGRRAACEMIGGGAWEAIVAMQAAIIESGGKPLLLASELRGIFILAADDLLPKHVVITPPIYAATVALTTVGQAFVRRKKIQEAGAKRRLGVVDGGKKKPATVTPIVPSSPPVEGRAAPETDAAPTHDAPAPRADDPAVGPPPADPAPAAEYPPPDETVVKRPPGREWDGIA